MSLLDAEKLISQMKRRPALWDLRNYNYNNRTLCDSEWSKMAVALHLEKDSVKAKWKSLRDTYRRELRKAKLGQKSRWVHYGRMSFLREALEVRDRMRAAPDTTTTEDNMSPATKWYGDDDVRYLAPVEPPPMVAIQQQQQAVNVIQPQSMEEEDEEEEEESFPVIKEPEVELTMDDISVRGYQQSTSWMDDDNLADNPRKMFLLSLLPDLEQMSEPQMRLFKKTVLQLTCDILDSNVPMIHPTVHLGDGAEENHSDK